MTTHMDTLQGWYALGNIAVKKFYKKKKGQICKNVHFPEKEITFLGLFNVWGTLTVP